MNLLLETVSGPEPVGVEPDVHILGKIRQAARELRLQLCDPAIAVVGVRVTDEDIGRVTGDVSHRRGQGSAKVWYMRHTAGHKRQNCRCPGSSSCGSREIRKQIHV